MRRPTASAVVILCFLVTVSASAANRERVVEVWRSRYGCVCLTGPENVNQSDGSVWVKEGANVTHFSRAGELLGRTPALAAPHWMAANPVDDSCWIAQGLSSELTHAASDGSILSTTPGLEDVVRIAVSPYDSSVWVLGATWVNPEEPVQVWYLAHVSAGGHELSRAAGFRAVVVDPADGSAWACSDTSTVRLRADGTQEWTAPVAGTVIDEDGRDQSVWVVSQDPATFVAVVTHLSSSGQVLSQTSGPAAEPAEVHVSHTDGSAWVTCSPTDPTPALAREETDRHDYTAMVVRFDASGVQLGRLDHASIEACNDLDGSVWVYRLGDTAWELAQYSPEMHEIRHFTPCAEGSRGWRAYDQAENTFWTTADVSELGTGPWEFQRLGPDGTVLWHQRMPRLAAVPPGLDPQDGSIWAADPAVPGGLVRYSPEGVELEWRLSLPLEGMLRGLLISPTDGSWWVTAAAPWSSSPPLLYHLSADGTLLSSFSGVAWQPMLDEQDGSVWGAWADRSWEDADGYHYHSFLRHLAADGTELLTKEYSHAVSLSGVAADGSIWLLLEPYPGPEAARLEHVSVTGEAMESVVPALAGLWFLFSPADGSFYAGADYLSSGTGRGWVGKMASDGSALWVHDGFWWPQIVLNPDDGSLWVVDAGNYVGLFAEGSAVVHYAADGTERWRGETFNGPGAVALDRRDGSVWISDWLNEQLVHLAPARSPFTDVPEDHWAFGEIVACFEAGIVMGFGDDTYRPALPVARDAMAVYIARALAGGDDNVPTGPAEATFVDVPNTGCGEDGLAPYWAYRYVEYCVGQNIVQGYDATHYRPSAQVDRGQMAVYIARALVTPSGDAAIPDPPDAPAFHDVTAENEWAWCYPHVEYCVAEGVVQGYSPGTYRPEVVVTRDQMAVYVARAFALEQASGAGEGPFRLPCPAQSVSGG